MGTLSSPTIVRLSLLMALFRNTNGLEFSLSHSSFDLPGRRAPCGVLLCTENRLDTTGNVSLPQIVNMTVFKTFAPTLGRSGSSASTSLTQLATVSSTRPNLDQVANGMMLSGLFTNGQVNLKIELFKETDCLGEFTCVLTEVNAQGERVIHSHRLLPQRPKQEKGRIQETVIISLMLMKQLTAMEGLNVKLSLIANDVERLESNVHMVDDKVCQLDSKLSAVDSEAIQEKVLGTIKAQIDDHFSKLFEASKGTDDILKTTATLLTSINSQNIEFQNNVMENYKGLVDNVTRETETDLARLNLGFERLEKSFETNQSLHEAMFHTFQSMLASLKRNFTSWKDVMEAKVARNKMINDQLSKVGKNLTDTNNLISALRNDQSSQDKRLVQFEAFLKSINQWPGGYYALLRPKPGCPLDLAFFGGTHSYLKLHTQSQSSSDPDDDHSAAFGQNTKSKSNSNRFVTLEFCEVTGQWNSASWPQGTFCFHNLLDHSCPDGFLEGYVRFDDEDINPATVRKNNVASEISSHEYLYFCCQDTAPATVPIQLPTHSPFLLYRRGGVCQAVQGMSVSEEFVQINTEDSSNSDGLSGSHPDVDQPGSSVIKLNLCYYTKL